MKFRIVLSILMAVITVACASKTKEIKPPIEIPGEFSASGKEPFQDKWWQGFNDPDINILMDQALKGNLNLKIAWERLAQAEAVAQQARAGLYPSANLEGGVSRIQTKQKGFKTTYSNNYSLGLSAGYELDLWGRVRAGRDAASLDVYAGQENLMTAAISLSGQMVSAWYQLVDQYGQKELLLDQISTNEKVLKVVTIRFRRGRAPAADVLQQRQLLETNHGEKAQVESRIKVLEHQLAILMGIPPNRSDFHHVTRLPVLPALPDMGVPSDLIQRRPDIKGSYYSLLAADRRVAEAIADRFPRISLAAQVSTSAGGTTDLFNNWINTIGANFLGPVIDGGRRRAEVDRTKAVTAERLHSYGQTILEALTEIEDALIREKRRREYVNSLQKQLTLSAQAMESIRDRYTKGAEDYLRVLSALSTHQQLQRTHLGAERDLIQDRIDLCRALAGGWEMERTED